MENIKPREVSKEAARRFLILRQSFLQGKRGENGTLEAIKRPECVQKVLINVQPKELKDAVMRELNQLGGFKS